MLTRIDLHMYTPYMQDHSELDGLAFILPDNEASSTSSTSAAPAASTSFISSETQAQPQDGSSDMFAPSLHVNADGLLLAGMTMAVVVAVELAVHTSFRHSHGLHRRLNRLHAARRATSVQT